MSLFQHRTTERGGGYNSRFGCPATDCPCCWVSLQNPWEGGGSEVSEWLSVPWTLSPRSWEQTFVPEQSNLDCCSFEGHPEQESSGAGEQPTSASRKQTQVLRRVLLWNNKLTNLFLQSQQAGLRGHSQQSPVPQP